MKEWRELVARFEGAPEMVRLYNRAVSKARLARVDAEYLAEFGLGHGLGSRFDYPKELWDRRPGGIGVRVAVDGTVLRRLEFRRLFRDSPREGAAQGLWSCSPPYAERRATRRSARPAPAGT